jgi:hypothetical protein
LYYPGIGAVPDLSKPHYFTCPRLPVAMRITGGDRWKPAKEKPGGAIEVQCTVQLSITHNLCVQLEPEENVH